MGKSEKEEVVKKRRLPKIDVSPSGHPRFRFGKVSRRSLLKQSVRCRTLPMAGHRLPVSSTCPLSTGRAPSPSAIHPNKDVFIEKGLLSHGIFQSSPAAAPLASPGLPESKCFGCRPSLPKCRPGKVAGPVTRLRISSLAWRMLSSFLSIFFFQPFWFRTSPAERRSRHSEGEFSRNPVKESFQSSPFRGRVR